MKSVWIALPVLALSLSSCVIDRMNNMINESTRAIQCNRMAVEQSTCAIMENQRAVEESSAAIEENKRALKEINESLGALGAAPTELNQDKLLEEHELIASGKE